MNDAEKDDLVRQGKLYRYGNGHYTESAAQDGDRLVWISRPNAMGIAEDVAERIGEDDDMSQAIYDYVNYLIEIGREGLQMAIQENRNHLAD